MADLTNNLGVVAAIDAVATLVDAQTENGAWIDLGEFETNMFAVEVTGVDTASYALSVEYADDISGTNPVDPIFVISPEKATFVAATGALTQVLKIEAVRPAAKGFARVNLTPTGGAGSSKDGYAILGSSHRGDVA